MFGKDAVSDKELLKHVTKQLTRSGSQAKITATISRGTVTLSGTLQYEVQRNQIISSAGRVPGVNRVVDQLKLVARKMH